VATLEIPFRLPLPGWPRAVVVTNFSYRGGALRIGGREVAVAESRDDLEAGASGRFDGAEVTVQLVARDGAPRVVVDVDGRAAVPEKDLRAPPSRPAWVHAFLALAASFAGFVASYLYLRRASAFDDPWSLKMAWHMAAWHLLLTFTLFPASVWGQRVGIRIVQLVSFVFFGIHAGIAGANVGSTNPGIALFNGASGALFLVATFYGIRAWRSMDPVAALRARCPRRG
jgi:hypothetical protein